MEAILEKLDLKGELSGTWSGQAHKSSGPPLESISPIDSQRIAKVRCASETDTKK